MDQQNNRALCITCVAFVAGGPKADHPRPAAPLPPCPARGAGGAELDASWSCLERCWCNLEVLMGSRICPQRNCPLTQCSEPVVPCEFRVILCHSGAILCQGLVPKETAHWHMFRASLSNVCPGSFCCVCRQFKGQKTPQVLATCLFEEG